ncbi:hypothetical protein A3I40_00170 [Candidatus Uhrbacteria bacterium RIFCSPLOWO2_02_FULL_48_12]|uniref:Glycosyltransferase 2-like domain-containing protein n=1 Tax=Candidatus Uhrbacteria bacterium RIFCSPLOWO2_02_FULL_48_12 TaxID=1802407 RepID=A0A1F7VA57_9BACT|nr:MAG: hypothetical protein A3I40_00170 [Candidatus Uhrbacteria bacterium RIFCSPLOWO2_02_FULL_48_12]
MLTLTDRSKYRILEMIPGMLVWATFILAVTLSFVRPLWAVYFIILFDLYWLWRVSYFVFYTVLSWRLYNREIKRHWFADLERDYPAWRNMYHLIFLPTYREDLSVIEATVKSLTQMAYDPKRFIVILAGEERDAENFAKISSYLADHYRHFFYDLVVTVHPANLPDEIPGKGSNLNWSGHRLKKYVDSAGLPYQNLIVSSFDVDTLAHRQYFACLTYKFLSHPNPTHASYQPAVLYNNNIWDAPAITRVAAFGTTFWLMTELARPERLFTFSSHSMSWQALVDVGFWEKQIVTEDSRIFLQCFLRYDGDYSVTPIYVPVSMDMVMAKSYLKSLVSLYKQQRRWAWGIEHLPYMLWNFSKNPRIPWRKKLYYIWNLSEGMYSWATAPILIFLIGRLPLYVAPMSMQQQALFQNAPFVLEKLLQLSMIGIFVSVLMSLKLLPPRPSSARPHAYLTMIFQWLLLPITFGVFGSLPATEAQTRLMFGRYLGFNVTEKARSEI